jgi:hypothetical protein
MARVVRVMTSKTTQTALRPKKGELLPVIIIISPQLLSTLLKIRGGKMIYGQNDNIECSFPRPKSIDGRRETTWSEQEIKIVLGELFAPKRVVA